ncbi:hypothetical protein HOG48_04785 [Candidatus Peregrinibacteria bacterium]|jgi:hypothetical protein|nr:hypothetical protein [Candidatus Peregrinibacteria bacterium]
MVETQSQSNFENDGEGTLPNMELGADEQDRFRSSGEKMAQAQELGVKEAILMTKIAEAYEAFSTGESALEEQWAVQHYLNEELTPSERKSLIQVFSQTNPNGHEEGGVVLTLFPKSDRTVEITWDIVKNPTGVTPQVKSHFETYVDSLRITAARGDGQHIQTIVTGLNERLRRFPEAERLKIAKAVGFYGEGISLSGDGNHLVYWHVTGQRLEYAETPLLKSEEAPGVY